MKLEVLMATNKENLSEIIERTSLECDAVIAQQQSDECSYKEEKHNYHTIKIITTNTCGVGINRNISLAYSNADICLLADDDMKYVHGYAELVIEAFEKLKNADVIIFNIDTIGVDPGRRVNNQIKRVRLFNFMNYGSVRIAFRRKVIESNNIWFTNLFGGGEKFSAGEDVSFLASCLKAGLSVYTYPAKIADVEQNESSWFEGFTRKYYYDKGALLAFNFKGLLKYGSIIYFAFKNRTVGELGFLEIFKLMMSGAKEF